MENKEILNCNNCLYANGNEDGSVMCDKVLLLYGKEIYVESSKVDLPCPSHSSRYIEETRYMWNNDDVRDAEDSCEVCGRRVDMNDETQYNFIEVQDEKGKVVGEKIQCKICRHKGRR